MRGHKRLEEIILDYLQLCTIIRHWELLGATMSAYWVTRGQWSAKERSGD